MAAFGLLLLLGTAVVAPVRPQRAAQERLVLQHPHIEQLLQEEQDPPLPPDIPAAAGATAAPPSPAQHPGRLPPRPGRWPPPSPVTAATRRGPPRPSSCPPAASPTCGRQAAALDALRPRLGACCRHHAPLPCARRAWTEVLDDFCTDEFGVKTRQFHCCRRHDAARRRCFAQGPSGATAEAAAIVTARDPPRRAALPARRAHRRQHGQYLRVTGAAPPAPPAPAGPLRPPACASACAWSATTAAAAATGAWPAPATPRQGDPNQSPPQWQKGLQRFCREESAVKTRQHRCCRPGGAPARSRCFAAAAPHPAYDRELHNVSLARPGPALLRTLCGPTRLFTKRRPVPELLGAVTATCCPLPPEEQSACAQEQLSQGIATLCDTSRDTWRDPQGCCSRGGPERRRCFDTTYLAQVTLGAAVAPPAPDHDE
ncbi:unnamed protein product [Bubo scandiacus]